MRLRLIENGGYAGKTKSAEMDFDNVPRDIQTRLQDYIAEPVEDQDTGARDLETYYWVLNGKDSSYEKKVDPFDLPAQLKQLFNAMRENLKFDR